MSYRVYDESFLDICHRDIRTIYEHWKSLTSDGSLPSRRDIEPSAIVRLLPFIMLVDVEHPGPKFRYRLVGTGEVNYRGNNPTGKYLEEAFSGPDGNYCDGNYRYVTENQKPLYDTAPEVTTRGNPADVEVLFLPLSSNGEDVDCVLVFSVIKLGVGEHLETKMDLAGWAKSLI